MRCAITLAIWATALGLATAACEGARSHDDVTLSVVRSGTGDGTVHGGGICCGGDCREAFARGAVVTLTASAAARSTLARWSGCDYAVGSTCAVTMDTARVVEAKFSAVELSGGAAHRVLASPRR